MKTKIKIKSLQFKIISPQILLPPLPKYFDHIIADIISLKAIKCR